jgi:hypothetical protein
MPLCHRGLCCAFFKESIMRLWFFTLSLACLSFAVRAQSVHTFKLINDTRTTIISFTVSIPGNRHGAEVDFRKQPFDSATAVNIELYDGDGCLRDLHTQLSDGRNIVARGFNVCTMHAYRPGLSFHNGHPGGWYSP